MAGWATWGSGVAGSGGDVADGEHLGMPGHRQVVADQDAATAAQFEAEQPASGLAVTPAAHTMVPAGIRRAVGEQDGVGLDVVDAGAEHRPSIRRRAQRGGRLIGQRRGGTCRAPGRPPRRA